MEFWSSTKIRVRYAETDKMGIVYHSNYLIWFEVGRTELFRKLNLPYTLFEEQKIALAVVQADCRYRKPTHYDDELNIITKIGKISSRGATFLYQIYHNETLVTEGKTVHIFINEQGRPIDIRKYEVWPLLQNLLEK